MNADLEAKPWLAKGAQAWLEAQIQPEWAAFEWGSGGSTLWLEGLCAAVFSVEHDRAWWEKVGVSVVGEHTVTMLVYPGAEELGDDPANPEHYRSSCQPGNFQDYASVIDVAGEFDLILVDGRARASCITHAVPRVMDSGILVLDNAERDWYTDQTEHLLEGWDRVDFQQGEWVTSAWMKN